MTEQAIIQRVGYPREILAVGQVTMTWCSLSMEREPHIYTGTGLVCQCERCKQSRENTLDKIKRV